MKRNIKLLLAYDGTDFCGWQIQKKDRTVQGEIESALKRIEGREVRLTGSGRTDSGVHANGQVANFYTQNRMPAEKFAPAINSLLKNDLKIIESSEVSESFHARFDAKQRNYLYYLKQGGVFSPFTNRYSWEIRQNLDIERLNRLSSPLVGVHDFSAFTASGDMSKSKVREIFSASFFMKDGFLVFKISGNAFLWKMVRSILGTIIDLEGRNADADEMKGILEKGKREKAGTTAPASGLFLDRVIYE